MKTTPSPRRVVPVIALILLAAAGFTTSACRTTAGFGRDVQKVGNTIAQEAERHG